MSMISAIKTYMKTYTGLITDAPVWVDYLGPDPTEYTIIPLAGTRIIQEDITGKTLREYPFAFQSMESTADEKNRIAVQEFFEDLAAWFETQTLAGTFPTLAAGQTAEKIEALGWAYLFESGESGTGIYQIQCKLTYEQE